MAEKHNANCSICGRPYYKCISCKDTMSANPWKAYCDTAEHYKVHQVIRGFNSGIYTKNEASDKLKNINLYDVESFRPHIKKIVNDILKEDKPIVETVCAEIANVNNNVVAEDIEVEKTEDIIKATYSRKRNFKVEE